MKRATQQTLVAFTAALLLAPLAALHSAEGLPAGVSTYREIYRSAVERQLMETDKRRRKSSADINTAYAAWMLGEARYRDFALSLYDRFLGEKVNHDFHISRPFGLLTWRLHQAGVLTGKRREQAQRQARERITWFLDQRKNKDEFFDCNIALADTLAVDCLVRVFADDPTMRPAEVQRAVAALGQRILETGDLNENANNYSSLGICFFLELAKLEGWLDEVRRSDHFRIMFTRMRDIISPTGTIPEYGDG